MPALPSTFRWLFWEMDFEALDLFSFSHDADLERIHRAVTAVVSDLRVLARAPAALKMVVGRAAVDLVQYPYPLLDPPGPRKAAAPVPVGAGKATYPTRLTV